MTDEKVPPKSSRRERSARDRLRGSLRAAACVGGLGSLFVWLSHRPLWHTDLWGHLAYGRWISEHGRLPRTEPLMPLSEARFVDPAWLSQLTAHALHSRFGVTALQFLYAASITLASALLLIALLRRTGSLVAAAFGVCIFGGVNYQQLLIVRPQLAGLVCFMVVFLTGLETRPLRGWGRDGSSVLRRGRGGRGPFRLRGAAAMMLIAATFALWANLHGSFLVGLVTLAALCAGRAVDVLRRTRDIRFSLADRRARHLLLLTVIGGLAALLTPYGATLYAEVLRIAGHPNVQDLIEWQPLTLRMSQGRAAGLAALLLIVAYRLSPRRITTAEVLLIGGFGAAALWSSRMIHWWAPVAAYYLAVHAQAVCRRWQRSTGTREGLGVSEIRSPKSEIRNKLEIRNLKTAAASGSVSSSGRGFRTFVLRACFGFRASDFVIRLCSALLMVAAAALAVVCFLSTPFGLRLLSGPPESPQARAAQLRASVSALTPLGAAEFLRRNPPRGQIFNTYEWGDYLLWAGPENLQVFLASHAHLVPPDVWRDALNIARTSAGWEALLDTYEVQTIVTRNGRRRLVSALRDRPEEWTIAYEDRLAVVFVRQES